jgi:hypothetical protein
LLSDEAAPTCSGGSTDITVSVAGGMTLAGDDEQCGQRADDDDRHIDQEDRAPPEVIEQQAIEDRADGRPGARCRGPDGDGPVTLSWSGSSRPMSAGARPGRRSRRR